LVTDGFVVRVGGVDGLVIVYGPKVEAQPFELVTLSVYTPAGRLLRLAVVPTDWFAAFVQL
jgi:hypothetical protein